MNVAQETKTFPTVKKLFLLGNALQYEREGRDFFRHASLEYGLHFKTHVYHFPVYAICHPDSLERVLVKNEQNYIKGVPSTAGREVIGSGLIVQEGKHWYKDRQILNPLFTKLNRDLRERFKAP